MQSNMYYENASEIQIIQSRSFKELDIWISHVNYLTEECDRLAKIAAKLIQKSELGEELLLMIQKSTELLTELHNARNATENLSECDDVACDLFYLNEHESTRELYLKHIESYRKLKEEVLLQLLNK